MLHGNLKGSQWRRGETSEPLAYVPGVSASSSAASASLLQAPTPPTVPAPPIPTEATLQSKEMPRYLTDSPTRFSTVRSEVRSGAIRVDITNPQQWSAGDIAVIRNQEAKKVRDIGSLIFETPIQHDYEAGVEVRSLLPTEQLEEIDGRLAVLDNDPTTGTRFVKFRVDEIPFVAEGSPVQRREREALVHETSRDRDRISPDFGGGVDYHDHESTQRERIPLGGNSDGRERAPNAERSSPPRIGQYTGQSRTPPEDQIPRGCSLHSMERLRDWSCKGADMTSAAEYEAALVQLEEDPPDIRHLM